MEIETVSPTRQALLRYMEAMREAGCPEDQARNFLNAGIVLQPKQLAFAAAARECDRPGGPVEVGFGGARMGGKSHATLAVMGADDCVRHPGLKCLLLRKVGISARESFESLLPKTIGRLGRYFPSLSVFKFNNGSWIRLGHFEHESDIDKYLGLEYDVISTEEATTLSDSKQEAVASCCRSPEGSGWRARQYKTMNPGGVGHASIKARLVIPYRKRREKDTRFIPSTVDDNAFATEEYRTFLDGLTGWLKSAWRYGDWDIAAGQFFTTWRGPEKSRSHVIKPFRIPQSWEIRMGFDYGFTHYTSTHPIAESGDGDLFVIGEHCERRWLPERHARSIYGMLARQDIRPYCVKGIHAGADVFAKKQRGGTIADDYKSNEDHPLVLLPANDDRINGAAELLRRLGDVDAGIEPSIFIFDTCTRLIECIPSLEHDPHRPEDVKKVDADDKGQGGDDPYDDLRYGIMGFMKPKHGQSRAGGTREKVVIR